VPGDFFVEIPIFSRSAYSKDMIYLFNNSHNLEMNYGQFEIFYFLLGGGFINVPRGGAHLRNPPRDIPSGSS